MYRGPSFQLATVKAYSLRDFTSTQDVSWMMSKSSNTACALVIADPVGRLCLLDIAIKDKAFLLIKIYALNDQAERRIRRIDLFLTSRLEAVASDIDGSNFLSPA